MIRSLNQLKSFQHSFNISSNKLALHDFKISQISDRPFSCGSIKIQQPSQLQLVGLDRPLYRFSTVNSHAETQTSEEYNPLKTSLYVIKNACEYLLQYDSLTFDNLAQQFSRKYILRSSLISLSDLNENKKQTTSAMIKVYAEPKHLLPKTDIKKSPLAEVQKIYDELSLIYQFLTAARVGFLRGDINCHSIFRIHKYVQDKLITHEKYELRKVVLFQKEDFQKCFRDCTDSKSFRLPSFGIIDRSLECSINLYKRQIILQKESECHSQQKFQSILQSLIKINKAHQSQAIRKIILNWLVTLTKSLREEQKKCYLTQQLKGNRKKYAQELVKLNMQKLGAIALSQLMVDIFQMVYTTNENLQPFEFQGISEYRFIHSVAKSIYISAVIKQQETKFLSSQQVYDDLLNSQVITQQIQNPDNADIKPQKPQRPSSGIIKLQEKNQPYPFVSKESRKQYLYELEGKITRKFSKFQNHFQKTRLNAFQQLSKMLVYVIKDLIKVDNQYGLSVPLLTTQHKFVKKHDKVYNLIILNVNDHFLSTIIPQLEKHQDLFIHMENSVPTLILPMPWIDPEIGGYYSQATRIMRYSNCPVQERVLKHADNWRIYEALNELNNVKWKINKGVLHLVEQIWKEGGGMHYIPKRYSQGKIAFYLTELKGEKNFKKIAEIKKKIQKLRDDHSLRSDFLLKLNIAQSFKNLDCFYFPHNIDFRGRAYPIPPHFNHIGNDLVRGLLLFGEGKQLGDTGLKWLKIHCANLMGNDKATITEKLSFIEANIDLIHEIAKNPLKNRIWLTYEDSWQAISSIIQLSQALSHPNPSEFISYLHIHQDGSCNGLQHYAALGRDMEGAYQVNLGVTQRPGDVYTYVANMVKKQIQKDKLDENGKNYKLAHALTDNIKRKTIKQTVMTSVYGVTFVGAKEQIYRQLRDQNILPQEQTYRASLYVAKLTMEAISNLFSGAHAIKKWFRQCARIVVKNKIPLSWISPLGLPIVQPYRKQGRQDEIKTTRGTLSILQSVENLSINQMKQATAFPPNFVHSLDSTHMMYTCMACRKQNLTFAAVHDSYWAHAGNIEKMNTILREEFIRLHSEPLLQNFKKSLEKRLPHEEFPQIPQRGKFDLQIIKDSIYFFS